MPAFEIYADLAGDRIVLLITGDASHPDALKAAKALPLLTPLVRPTNPKGAVQLAATWPAVVQLQATFGPVLRMSPDLAEWVANEIAKREAL